MCLPELRYQLPLDVILAVEKKPTNPSSSDLMTCIRISPEALSNLGKINRPSRPTFPLM